MNFRYIINQTGVLLLAMAAVLLGIAAWSWCRVWIWDHTGETGGAAAFLFSALGGGGAGGLAWFLTRGGSRQLERRDAMLLVAVSWNVGAILAAAPFYLWAQMTEDPAAEPFLSLASCYFEAVSGLTTTGATISWDIEHMARPVQLWRALTHWIGGLGIIVLYVAVLPSLGVGAKRLFRVEAGTQSDGVQPHVRETARTLWWIYCAFTGAAALSLKLGGHESWFDSICIAFSTLSTGGFANHDASIGTTGSAITEWTIVMFMVLAGVNFGLYHQLLRRRFTTVLKDPELRLYLAIILFAGLAFTLLLVDTPITTTAGTTLEPSAGAASRYGAFAAVSMMTGTGFGTADYTLWPPVAKGAIVLLMFMGGCVGSTTGGLKILRVWIAARVLLGMVERTFRPSVVRPIKIGGTTLDADAKIDVLGYIVVFVSLVLIGGVAVLALEPKADLVTAFTASLATLGNVGPGLARVGAIENFAWMSGPTKVMLAQFMLLGRLEIFAIVVLFSPRFWREL